MKRKKFVQNKKLQNMHHVRSKAPNKLYGTLLSIFSSMVVAASCYGYACHRQGQGRFLNKKNNKIELSRDNILEDHLVQSAFQQTLGDKFPFQQDNNLNHKANNALTKLLTKATVNVPGWPSYSFDLNLLENL